MPVYYRNHTIIPAPLVSIGRQFSTTRDGEKIGQSFRVSLQGTILSYKGSPSSSGTFWDASGYPDDEVLTHDQKLRAILRKQEALRELFATDGGLFEIQPWDGSTSTKCNPRIIAINFPEGIWTETCPYTVDMETDVIMGPGLPSGEIGFSPYISDAQETWALELDERGEDEANPFSFRVTHNVSAVGKRFYNDAGSLTKPAWEQARDWVLPRIGLDLNMARGTGVFNLPDTYASGFNHVRSQNVNELGGEFAVTESWVLAKDAAREDFTVQTVTSSTDGLTRVTINGQIEGLEIRDGAYGVLSSKWASASGKYATIEPSLITRAQNYGGVSLNPVPNSKTIGRNPIGGTISYAVEYDTRPSNYIAGALSEDVQITDKNATDVIALIPVLGRTAGPVIQDIGTKTETIRTLNINAIVSGVNSVSYAAWTAAKPVVSGLVAEVRPSATQVFVTEDSENWNPKTGVYNKTISWTYQ